MTVDCPFECEYLQDARRHEKLPQLKPDDIPNRDIRVTESFLDEHNQLVIAVSGILFTSVMQVPGAIDFDVREALSALIKTYRTLESGLIYESRPSNPLAAGIQQLFEQQLREYRQALAQRTGINTIRDSEILGVLVFLERLELQYNNGRRRGRAFLDMLRRLLPTEQAPAASNLIVG